MKNIKLKILTLITISMMVLGCSQKDYTDRKELKILVVGDSLSDSYQINPDKSWTKLIQDKFDENSLNVSLVNISQSGDRTADALKKHQEHLEVKADIVIMNIGANDALKRVNVEETIDNYTEMVESFKSTQQKPEILLVNIKPPSAVNVVAPFVSNYTKVVPTIADKYRLSYVKDFFDGLDSGLANNKHFLADKVHPSELAQPILAENIYKAVLPLIEKKHNQ